MAVFDEIQFPTDIAYGSSGGPNRRTEIVVLDSGFEQRNTPWSQSRRRFDVSYGIKSFDQLHAVIVFWEARGGALTGFRYKDFSDFKSVAPLQAISDTDQVIGTGDTVETDFQLVKKYVSGPSTYTRDIKKPVAGTTIISLNDVSQPSGWSVNTITGVVTFSSPPAGGVVVKAGYEFDVPSRFEDTQLTVSLDTFQQGSLDPINIVEVRV